MMQVQLKQYDLCYKQTYTQRKNKSITRTDISYVNMKEIEMEATILISIIGIISMMAHGHQMVWVHSLQRRLIRNRELLRSYYQLIKMQRRTIEQLTDQNQQFKDIIVKMTTQQAQMSFNKAFEKRKLTCNN